MVDVIITAAVVLAGAAGLFLGVHFIEVAIADFFASLGG